MVEVNLWSGLRALAEGQEKVEVEGRTVGQLLDNLVARYPGMEDAIEQGVSVAVNGRIIASSLSEPVPEDAEVFLMMRLRGG
jgi:molybdopterin synthase sulfur carrier subunit